MSLSHAASYTVGNANPKNLTSPSRIRFPPGLIFVKANPGT